MAVRPIAHGAVGSFPSAVQATAPSYSRAIVGIKRILGVNLKKPAKGQRCIGDRVHGDSKPSSRCSRWPRWPESQRATSCRRPKGAVTARKTAHQPKATVPVADRFFEASQPKRNCHDETPIRRNIFKKGKKPIFSQLPRSSHTLPRSQIVNQRSAGLHLERELTKARIHLHVSISVLEKQTSINHAIKGDIKA